MKHFTDDLHSAFMALELAQRLQSRGSQVILPLDLDGLDSRMQKRAAREYVAPESELLQRFLKPSEKKVAVASYADIVQNTPT